MIHSIKASELLLNLDGSIFHLHLMPEELADDVILVGDPGRVEMIASHFDHIEYKKSNADRFLRSVGVTYYFSCEPLLSWRKFASHKKMICNFSKTLRFYSLFIRDGF